jgi:Ca-activated chloride channel family protein
MQWLADFHFLRPLWLLGLIPSAGLLFKWWRLQRAGRGWQGVVSKELLPHLLVGKVQQHSSPLFYLCLVWLAACIALAGPAWEKLPQPVQRNVDSMVVLYDLSLSMLAEDTRPSRLIRSRQKLLDLLVAREDGNTALIAYAGDAHVVSPLTDDDRTVANLLSVLDPQIMPIPGSKPELAVSRAVELLADAGMGSGQILLVTDGITDSQVKLIESELAGTSYRLSVIGVGTKDGGPIPLPQGLLKDQRGNIVLAALDRAPLRKLARANGGVYSDLTLDDTDLEQVLNPGHMLEMETDLMKDRSADSWLDMGFWLLLLLIPAALASFRRGWILCLLILLPHGETAQALEWSDLWSRPDQQAAQLLQQGEPAEAAAKFDDPDWAAAANYRAGNFPAASEHYQSGDNAEALYNLGNSLARSGDYAAAIAAYDHALQQQPEMEDASFNKTLLEQLQQQQDQQDQQQQEQQQDQEQQDQQQQQQDQQQEGEQDQQQTEEQQEQDQSQQQEDEQQEQEQQQQQEDEQQEQDPPSPQQAEAERDDAAEEEREMANEQWLRRIPDDPSGLLRRKFEYESKLRASERSNTNETAW